MYVNSEQLRLDLKRLIADLIVLGCGQADMELIQIPRALTNGGRLQLLLVQQHVEVTALEDPNELLDQSAASLPEKWNSSTDISSASVGVTPHSVPSLSRTSFSASLSSRSASFMTAVSSIANTVFWSAYSGRSATQRDIIRENEEWAPSMPVPFRKLRDDYRSHLSQQKIVQPFEKELNWSGKGQHVMFLPGDPVPLTVLSHLGASMTAKVDKVLCRRIALARKTMRCSQQWTIAEALGEVYHLQNLRHRHIVQLVGSYLHGRDFSILMYPAADCHLGHFLEDLADTRFLETTDFAVVGYWKTFDGRISSITKAFACLTSALAYVHEHTTKHMDIKPQNILVRKTSLGDHRMYLADFGLSRSFASQGHSQTDGFTMRTPRYCVPEVFHHERRGRAADIFSLGCVFAEIYNVLGGRHPQDFADYRRDVTGDESFHANTEHARSWVLDIGLSLYQHLPERFRLEKHEMVIYPEMTDLLIEMLRYGPEKRPTAAAVQIKLASVYANLAPSSYVSDACCELPPEQYVVHEPSEQFRS